MKYMGSKARIAKHILPIILADRKPNQWYIEPFVGGCNLIDKVDGPRIGDDISTPLISLFQNIQLGWEPPVYVSENRYKWAKYQSTLPYEKRSMSWAQIGFIGFGCSYSGKYFGGYARGNNSKGIARNYAKESHDNIVEQFSTLESVCLFNCDYEKLPIVENSIVYCDPPYQGTTKYKTGGFNHEKFFNWCVQKAKEGNTVFVSEYNAPKEFECVWQGELISSTANANDRKTATEKLFKVRI